MRRGPHGGPRGKGAKAQDFWGTTGRLFSYLRPWAWGMIFSIVLAIISVILSIVSPKILGQATTTIYQGIMKGYAQMKAGQHLTALPIDFDKIKHIAIIVVLLYLFSGLFSLAQQVIMTNISQKVVYNLRRDVKAKMKVVPVKFYDTHSNGDLMSRMVNDMDNIATTLQQSLIQMITSVITFVGVLALMLSISWQLTLVALIIVPLSLGVVGMIAPRAQKLFSTQQEELGKINAQVEETFAGQTIVRTFNHEEDEEAKFAQKNEKYYHSAWLAQFFSILIFPFMNCIKNVGYLLVAVIGAVQIIHGQITLGNVQAFLQYTNQFSQPLTQVANLSSTIQQTIASAERIFEVLDAPEMDERILKDQPLPGHDQPKIEFKDVQFSYNDEPLIQYFNLKAPTNHMVAIVGPTGAGKSTIINLLERFYDVKGGHIYLDGHDTRTMTRSQLRTHIAMVLQDTWLFKGTIFDNIKYGREDATEEEVYQAARLAYADSFIRELPDGYQTVLDE